MNFPADLQILENELLSKHTTYRIGGPARHLAFPVTIEHLEKIGAHLRSSGEMYAVIGNGSNLLAPDEGFPGWIIKTAKLEGGIIFEGDRVRVGAGVLNASLLRACADKGLSGLEYLAGVPGTVGGAVFMNAGTASGWVEKNLIEVTAFSFAAGIKVFSKAELRYSYREQHYLPEDGIILSAQFELQSSTPEKIRAALAESAKARKQAQPIELPSCGSVFRNPPGTSAWKCVETAGLRGHKVGGARFSPKHANFIVNEGGATRADVLELIRLAKEKVEERLGIRLQEEVVVLEGRTLC